MNKIILSILLICGLNGQNDSLQMPLIIQDWSWDWSKDIDPESIYWIDTTGTNIPEENPTFISKWSDNTEYMILMEFLIDSNTVIIYQNFTALNLLALYEQYKTENIDTIRAIPFESEYIIDHGTYREMVTERQLEDRGYEYKYRWVIITDPLEFEYIWIKKQTLPGFMKWLKEKQ